MKRAFAIALVSLVLCVPSIAAASAETVLLERSTKGLRPSLDSSVIWVFASGKVYGQACKTVAKQTLPVTYGKVCTKGSVFKTLTPEEVGNLRDLIRETESGKFVYSGPIACAAVPVESITYWATHECCACNPKQYFYTGTQPCGSVYQNDSAAAKDLRQLLDELRQELAASL